MSVDRAARVAWAIAAAATAVLTAHVLQAKLGVHLPGTTWLASSRLPTVVQLTGAALCLARARRVRQDHVAWLLIGLGIGSWSTGEMVWLTWIDRQSPSFPSAADAFWLGFYALLVAGTAMLVHGHVRLRQRTLWLDGVIGGLVVTAVGLPPILSGGVGFAGSSLQAAAVNFTYPTLDLTLLAAIVAVFALTGWRPSAMWIAFGAALTLLAAGDITFLTLPTTASLETTVRPTFSMSLLVLGLAAWQTARDDAEVDMRSVRVMILPSLFALAAAGVLGYAAVRPTPAFAVGLALAALAGVVCRTWITVREIQALSHAHAAALLDELTGLGNRRSLYEEIERRIAERSSRPMAVLLLDIDSFKDLNDVLGHAVGDSLLIEAASRLRETIRAGDIIVRMGGDEFAVLLDGPADAGTAWAAATRIRDALERSFLLDGIPLHVAASIGAALYPDHGSDAQTLLRRADIAMYDAKSHGNAYRVYRGETGELDTRARLMLVEELRQAVDRAELEVHYQPKASLDSGRITGVEALIRWRHPTRGLLVPDTFLGPAERTGILRSITRFVLATALADCARWRAAGHDLSVAVNLSTVDLLDPNLAHEVAARIAEHGVPAGALRIEITEAVVMSDPVRAQAVLEALAAEGVPIALDDFGTGYSSLARLARLPVDELKIDRSFVAHMTTDPGHAAIVRSTVHLAHDLGLNVVAEGIELELQWDRLAELGCDEAQGYLLSRPVPAGELEEFLTQHDRRAA